MADSGNRFLRRDTYAGECIPASEHDWFSGNECIPANVIHSFFASERDSLAGIHSLNE